MKVLGIETSCDETAVAVVKDGTDILVNLIASQTAIHAPYGGVFPELASREHTDHILPLVDQAITQVGPIDRIAVAQGPGLIGALLMGTTAAKALAWGWNKPLVGVNHVEAHIYAAMMETSPVFPALGVVISGGHTFLVKMEHITSYQLLGTTVDDALGEAFDKVAALLGYPYPGGPHIEKLAQEGDPHKYPFRAGRVKERPLDFSFSGLKTNVLYAVKGPNTTRHAPTQINDADIPHIAASFQQAALEDIVAKTLKAAETFECQAIYLGGGVTQNQALRELLTSVSPYPLFWPPRGLSLDNAAMIAGLGYHLPIATENLHPFPRYSFKNN